MIFVNEKVLAIALEMLRQQHAALGGGDTLIWAEAHERFGRELQQKALADDLARSGLEVNDGDH
jgi:hypothetical protein